MMTLLSVAPSSRTNTASLSPPSDCWLHVDGLRSHWYMPPSKVAPAAMVLTAGRLVVPEGVGKVVWRLVLVVAEMTKGAARAMRKTLEVLLYIAEMVLCGFTMKDLDDWLRWAWRKTTKEANHSISSSLLYKGLAISYGYPLRRRAWIKSPWTSMGFACGRYDPDRDSDSMPWLRPGCCGTVMALLLLLGVDESLSTQRILCQV